MYRVEAITHESYYIPREKIFSPSSARWRWVDRAPVRATLSPPPYIILPPQCCPSTLHLRLATSWQPRGSLCPLHLAISLALDIPILPLHRLLHHRLSCRPHHPHKAICSLLHLNRYVIQYFMHAFGASVQCIRTQREIGKKKKWKITNPSF